MANKVDIGEALDLFTEKYKEKYGEDAALKEGEVCVTQFDNCVLIISCEEGNHLDINFVGGEILRVDAEVDVYEEYEEYE